MSEGGRGSYNADIKIKEIFIRIGFSDIRVGPRSLKKLGHYLCFDPNCTLEISLSCFNVMYGIISINKLQIFHSLTALCGYLNCASTIASNYKIPQKGASNCLRKNEISFIFMKHNDSYFFKFFTSFVCCKKDVKFSKISKQIQ